MAKSKRNPKVSQPKVAVVVASDSDLPLMEPAFKMLAEFQIPFLSTLASAHRSPERTSRIVREAEERGVCLFIAAAGGAAHLAGVIAAQTDRPVIGVPLDTSTLCGLDALLATVQMPGGVPVATMAIGKAGAKNAAVLAARILALSDPQLARRVVSYRAGLAREIEEKAARYEKNFR